LPALLFLALQLLPQGGSATLAQTAVPGRDKIGPDVLETLRSEGQASVVLALVEPRALKSQPINLEGLRRQVPALQAAVLSSLDPADFRASYQYEAVPALAGVVLNEEGLHQLATHPNVAKIDLDAVGQPTLRFSVPLIGADTHHLAGNTGRGAVVAVLDTGIDTDHADLSSGLIHQECFLDRDGSINGMGLCPNGSDRQSGPGAAEDDDGHGTHVSGIVASRGNRSSVGVAPGASIVAVKVISGIDGQFYFSDVLAGLDWILNYRQDVQVINMSLGTFAQFRGDCDDTTSWNRAGAAAVDALRSRGVITIAAAGNEGSATEMSSPACLRNVVSVGATDNSDTVAYFSNSNASTDIMAPGVGIVSSGMGNTTESLSGTSMASPHAAGCAALFISAGEAGTPDQIETRLETSPVQVRNSKNGLTYPRIDCSWRPQATVAIEGPTTGSPGQTYAFTARVSGVPAETVTYTWEATGQTTVTQTDGLSNTATFAWSSPGTKQITVTARGATFEVTTNHSIVLGTRANRIYLPLVVAQQLPVGSDASVLQGHPALNLGASGDMWVGYDHCEAQGQAARSLVQFNLPSAGAGPPVTRAILWLYLVNSCDIGERSHQVTAHRATSSWYEGSATWFNQPGFAEAYGSAVIPSRHWGWYTLDVTGLVQAWLNGSYPNRGLVLRSDESPGDDSARLGFITRESSRAGEHPYLQIVRMGQTTSEFVPARQDEAPAPASCGPPLKDSLGVSSGKAGRAEAGFVERSACGPD
jgi:subtilisin family serine protease